MSAASQLDALARAQPEWTPWLDVVRAVVPELSSAAWEAPALRTGTPSAFAPWLSGAVLQPDAVLVARLLERLRDAAQDHALHGLCGDRRRAASPDEALGLFIASVDGDDAALERHASATGATPEGVRALAQLLPMPYLHAWARRWAAAPAATWTRGYCPVCGAWPSFAEVRGVERTRRLRCGRCGAAWPRAVLTCTYCGSTDHATQGSLVPDDRSARWTLDVCRACSGYLKSQQTLQPTPSDEVLAADLASVAFDLAALDKGFARPPGLGHAPGVTLGGTAAAPPPQAVGR